MALGTLTLRLTVGGLVAAHGLQKLRGAFGGPGMAGTIGMTRSLGLHPAELNAQAIAWSETAGGAALALGAGTPAAAAAIIAGQVTALRKVHLPNGLWGTAGGYEYNLVLIAAATALASDGPGPISFDALLKRSRWGDAIGLLALAGGIAASFAVTEIAKRVTPPDDGASTAAAGAAPTDVPADPADAAANPPDGAPAE